MSVNRCGRPKQETSCCADRSDIGRWRSSTCCVILYRATVVGCGRDLLSTHVWLSVERSCDVPIMLRGASQTRIKEAHLTCSKLIQFKAMVSVERNYLANNIESHRKGIDWRLVSPTRLPGREPAPWQLRWVKAEQNYILFKVYSTVYPANTLMKEFHLALCYLINCP